MQHLPAVASKSELSRALPVLGTRLSIVPFARELPALLGSASIAGLVFGAVDIARAALAVPGSVGLQTGVALLGLWLWFAQLLGAATWAIHIAAVKIKRSVQNPKTVLGLLSACVCVTLLGLTWKLLAGGGFHPAAHFRNFAPWVIVFGLALVMWLALRLAAGWSLGAARTSSRRWIAATGFTLALASSELDARLAGGYLYFHVLLLALAVVVTTHAVGLQRLPAVIKQVALALPLLCAPSLLAFPASRGARALLTQPTWAGLQLVDYVQFHVDSDHDGHSPAFGGDDCDDRNATVFVGAPERPGDGRDSDCDGADDPRPTGLTFEPFRGLQDRVAMQIAERAKGLPTVVILVDALRFDRVGAARFPNLAKLAQESLRFTTVYATSSTTLSSVPAMMSGHVRPLRGHDSIVQAVGRAGQSSKFIGSEILRTHFQRLGAQNPLLSFSSSEFIPAEPTTDRQPSHRPSGDDRVTTSAIQDLQSAHPTDLLWLHYFDLHEWPSESDSRVSIGADDARYDAALERLDRSLAPLLALRDRAALILLADHGEGLGARGIEHHASFVFQELAHIPMLVRVPGIEPAVVDVPLGSTCVFNALRALRGLDADPTAAPSLFAFVKANAVGQGPGFASFETLQWSLLYGNHRLLYTPRQRLIELYDIQRDPRERTNRADEDPQLASQLLSRLFEQHNDLAR